MTLWGDKTTSIFDIWSIEHILAGIAFTGMVCLILKLFEGHVAGLKLKIFLDTFILQLVKFFDKYGIHCDKNLINLQKKIAKNSTILNSRQDLNPPVRKFADINTILAILSLSFIWEVFEHYLETGLWGKDVEFWFHGVEHWSNRMLGDSLAVLIGAYLYFKYPKILWPLKAVSIIWLAIHIFYFPHSMYLQQFL